MKYFFGTFGVSQKLHDKVQMILAENKQQAEKLMSDAYGKDWAFVYSLREFRDEKFKGRFKDVKKLPVIENKEAI